jgi:hypothetical protein
MLSALRPFVDENDKELNHVLRLAASNTTFSASEALSLLASGEESSFFLDDVFFGGGLLTRIALTALLYLGRGLDQFESSLVLFLLRRCRETMDPSVYQNMCFRACRTRWFGRRPETQWKAMELVFADAASAHIDVGETMENLGLADFLMEDSRNSKCLRKEELVLRFCRFISSQISLFFSVCFGRWRVLAHVADLFFAVFGSRISAVLVCDE